MSATFRCVACGEVVGSYHRAACASRGLVLPSEAPGCIEAAVAVVKNRDYARGVAAERARVVAAVREWVRGDGGFIQLLEILDRIERGEREENGNG